MKPFALTVEKAVRYGPTRSDGLVAARAVRLTLLAGVLQKGQQSTDETFTVKNAK